MKNDVSIEKILQELDEKMAWFHGDDFRLEEAKERFAELKSSRNVPKRLSRRYSTTSKC